MKNGATVPPVFTSVEVAKYLRLPEAKIIHLAEQGRIPAREIDGEWRFLKTAVDEWLARPDPTKELLKGAGRWADDETFPELCRSIEEARRRSDRGWRKRRKAEK